MQEIIVTVYNNLPGLLSFYFRSSGKSKNIFSEYFAIGDAAGQMTMMEIPKLFTEKVYLNIKFREMRKKK